MAQSKVLGTTAGGALAGAQIGAQLGTAGGPLGVAGGAIVGGLVGGGAGLVTGALMKENPVIKAQRKRARLAKLQGKKRGGFLGTRKAGEVRKDLRGDITELSADPRAAQYLDAAEAGEQAITQGDQPIVVQGGSDPTAGQNTLSTGGSTVTSGISDENIFRDAIRKGVEARLGEQVAISKMEEKATGQAVSSNMLAAAKGQAQQESMGAAKMGAEIGAIGASTIKTSQQMKARADLEDALSPYGVGKDWTDDPENMGYTVDRRPIPKTEGWYAESGFTPLEREQHKSALKLEEQQRMMDVRLHSAFAGIANPMETGRYGYTGQNYSGQGMTQQTTTTPGL